MADYFGLKAISDRIGVHVSSVPTLWHTQNFLMYKRRYKNRTTWYTNDQLIHTWQISKAMAGKNFRHAPRNPRVRSRDPEQKRSASGT